MTFHMLGIIIPTDELILFRGVGQPPTNLHMMIVARNHCSRWYADFFFGQTLPESPTVEAKTIVDFPSETSRLTDGT